MAKTPKIKKLRKRKKHRNRFLSFLSAFSYLTLLVVLAGLAFIIFSNKFSSKVPVLGGYSYLKVATGSMNPTIPTGSTIIIKNKPFNELTAPARDDKGKYINTDSNGVPTDGDIISFYAYISSRVEGRIIDYDSFEKNGFENLSNFKRVVITHRIYTIEEIDGKRFISTKGDNAQTNSSPDEAWYMYKDEASGELRQRGGKLFYVTQDDYIGSLLLDTPKGVLVLLGIVNHPLGMLLMVFIPLSAIIIIDANEFSAMKKKAALKKQNQKNKEPLPPPRPKKPPKPLN